MAFTRRDLVLMATGSTAKYGYIAKTNPNTGYLAIRILADETKTWHEFNGFDDEDVERLNQLCDKWGLDDA